MSLNRPIMNGDYAVIHVPNIGRLYYGYEETMLGPDGDDEWCFVASLPCESVVIPFSALPGARDMYDVAECIACGIQAIAMMGKIGAIE